METETNTAFRLARHSIVPGGHEAEHAAVDNWGWRDEGCDTLHYTHKCSCSLARRHFSSATMHLTRIKGGASRFKPRRSERKPTTLSRGIDAMGVPNYAAESDVEKTLKYMT